MDCHFVVLVDKKLKGSWRRVKVPDWKDEEITPGFVSNLLDWCYDETKEVYLVDYLGKLLE